MSYTPTLIIRKDQLEIALDTKRISVIDVDYEDANEDEDDRVESYLQRMVSEWQVSVISGMEIIVCQPEMSYFNEAVRDKLHEWDVSFTTSN